MSINITFFDSHFDLIAEENMEINLILKVAGIGIIVSLVSQILNKSGRDEQGLMLIISGIIVVFLLLIGELGDLFEKIKDVFEI